MANLGKLAGFVSHYAGEIIAVSSVLQTLTDHLPIDHGTKENIADVILKLQQAGKAAAAGAGALENDVRKIVVKKSDVDAAVRTFLESPAGAKVLAAAVKGSTNAGN